MSLTSRFTWQIRAVVAFTCALVLALSSTALAFASVTLVQLSSDPYTNTSSQHKTEVEPDNYSFGSTIVAVTQAGRFFSGGSSNIGWATSINSGSTWTHGFLPGTTVYATPKGTFARISDPSVAYDAAHNTWLISSLAISASGVGAAVLVSRSTNGGLTWNNPVTVSSAPPGAFYDKEWVVCDTTSSSSFYGHCYVEWDNNGSGNLILMSTSIDGGKTWGTPKPTANAATGIGGQPLVQPNGTVIVPIDDANESAVEAFTSTNGGTTWGLTVLISTISSHSENGGLRSGPLPSAEIDGAGKVYVAWQDCRFESGCSANDIVMSTSTNGLTWSAVKRIPIDGVGSGVDHFIPGIGVDKSTSGSSAHLGLAFYYYPVSNCSSCQLDVGFVSSTNGGTSWSAKTQLAGPMHLSWLANTNQGRMVGDYISTTIDGGKAYPVFAVAQAPSGSTFNEAMYTVAGGLSVRGGSHSSSDRVVATARPGASSHLTAF